MAGLPREIIRWIQSLDLTWQLKMPKWDLTNGYLIAEIFSWYFPQDITMHSYNSGASLDSKQRNWHLLKNFLKRNKIPLPEEVVEGTIHCKEGAATLLVRHMYEFLTNRAINEGQVRQNVDFTDRAYQEKLPMHARSTAAMSVKSNLKATEIDADRSIILSQHKSQKIIENHIEHRRIERIQDPKRFDIKPTLGERCARRPPPLNPELTDSSTHIHTEKPVSVSSAGRRQSQSRAKENTMDSIEREPSSVTFKEITVTQQMPPLYTDSGYNTTIPMYSTVK